MKNICLFESFNHVHKLELILTIFEDKGYITNTHIREYSKDHYTITYHIVKDEKNERENAKRYNMVNHEIYAKLGEKGYAVESFMDLLTNGIQLNIQAKAHYYETADKIINLINSEPIKMKLPKMKLRLIMWIANNTQDTNKLHFWHSRSRFLEQESGPLDMAIYTSTILKFYLSYYHRNGGIPRSVVLGVPDISGEYLEPYQKLYDIVKFCDNYEALYVNSMYFLRVMDLLLISDYFIKTMTFYTTVVAEIKKLEVPKTVSEFLTMLNKLMRSDSVMSNLFAHITRTEEVQAMEKVIRGDGKLG